MADPAALAALGAVTALLSVTLPERDAHPRLYGRTLDLVAGAGRGGGLAGALCGLGAGAPLRAGVRADLERCAVTGGAEDSGLGLAEVGAGGEPGGRRALGGAAPCRCRRSSRGGTLRRPSPRCSDGLALTWLLSRSPAGPGACRARRAPRARARALAALRRSGTPPHTPRLAGPSWVGPPVLGQSPKSDGVVWPATTSWSRYPRAGAPPS